MAKIVGPGSLIVDITGFASHLPIPGETVKGSTIRLGPGGKGTNQMTAAHRAGSQVAIIGRRSDDVLGKILEKHYKTDGISEKYITIDESGETGSAFISVSETDAQNSIIVVLGVNENVSKTDILAAEKEFADCDAVLTQFETSLESIVATKELAKKYNKPFILNPAPYVPCDISILDGVDYITPNETEAQQFTGIEVCDIDTCRQAATKFIEFGVKNVIITLGVRGVFFTDGKQEYVVPAVKVKALETTGAGDAFNGGFANAIGEGMPILTALQFATCTSAISVSRMGSSPSMPKREEILSLLETEFGVKI
jgi:ribokinase